MLFRMWLLVLPEIQIELFSLVGCSFIVTYEPIRMPLTTQTTTIAPIVHSDRFESNIDPCSGDSACGATKV